MVAACSSKLSMSTHSITRKTTSRETWAVKWRLYLSADNPLTPPRHRSLILYARYCTVKVKVKFSRYRRKWALGDPVG
jgi:hypothetical protein